MIPRSRGTNRDTKLSPTGFCAHCVGFFTCGAHEQGVTRGYKDGLQPETLADGNWLVKQNQPVSKIETNTSKHANTLEPCLVSPMSQLSTDESQGTFLTSPGMCNLNASLSQTRD